MNKKDVEILEIIFIIFGILVDFVLTLFFVKILNFNIEHSIILGTLFGIFSILLSHIYFYKDYLEELARGKTK